jgi:hypothetical protein
MGAGLHGFVPAGDVPGRAHDVLGPRLHCGEHGDDVVQRLPHLCDEVVAVEHALRVPAGLRIFWSPISASACDET